MTFGLKTNERPGTRAQVRYSRMSATKARQVLDLIRGKEVAEADEMLQFVERDAALVIRKCLASAVANAGHNDELDPEELFVSACFADEGPTLKRWRPRARGRATRIRKRTCHITIVVSRLPEDRLERRRAREAAASSAGGRRGRDRAASRRERVARSRRPADSGAPSPPAAVPDDEAAGAVAKVAGTSPPAPGTSDPGPSAVDVPDPGTSATDVPGDRVGDTADADEAPAEATDDKDLS